VSYDDNEGSFLIDLQEQGYFTVNRVRVNSPFIGNLQIAQSAIVRGR